MAQARNLVPTGLTALQANAITGTVGAGLTATGATQATALPLPGDDNEFTTVAAGTGCILQPMNPGDEVTVYNGGANALLIYPPVGGTINQLAANAGYSVATATRLARVKCINANRYVASQAA